MRFDKRKPSRRETNHLRADLRKEEGNEWEAVGQDIVLKLGIWPNTETRILTKLLALERRASASNKANAVVRRRLDI
jgi:hypothetical protein